MTEKKSNDPKPRPEHLVMKGRDRIEAVNTKYDHRVTQSFLTYQGNRLVRRDFNLMSVKLVMLSRNGATRLLVTELLADIACEADRLARRTEGAVSDNTQENLPLCIRITSPEAHQLFDALVVYDSARAKLSVKELGDVGDRLCTRFLIYYGRLKSLLFQPAVKTTVVNSH